jgi:hypothetical protein
LPILSGFFLSLTISTNFAKIWGKNRQILDITKLEKKKKNPTSLAEEAQKEETTWALGSHVLDNPLRHTSSSSIRMTEEEEEEEEEVT